MANSKNYKISALAPKNNVSFRKSLKNRRRKSLVFSVIAVYLLMGITVGSFLFGGKSGPAKASEAALISASIKLAEERDYKLGDSLKITMTLQNTSTVESINALAVDLYSTQNSIKWVDIKSDKTNENLEISPTGSFKLPVLSSGERAEYNIQGNIQSNNLDYLNILGRIKYLNKMGPQDLETNRIYTKLTSSGNNTGHLVSVAGKEKFNLGEALVFNLAKDKIESTKGKFYVSNADTQEVVLNNDCDLTTSETCEINIKSLPVGNYSSLYIDENENYFSNIKLFSVSGKKNDFIPNEQASLEFPIGNTSINGILPVIAKKVLSLNQIVSTENICTFEIYLNKQLVNTAKAAVDSDRSCRFTFNSEYLNRGNNTYVIKLANTSIEKDIFYTNKPDKLFALTNKTGALIKGKNADIEATGITDPTGNIATDKKVTLAILHQQTGEYTEINNLNGNTLKVVDGVFSTSISSNSLSKGGTYIVNFKTEDGLQSDWLTLSFEDKQVGFSKSGVITDTKGLKIGQDIILTLDNLIDRSGNQISEGECSANVYSAQAAATITVPGQIKKGVCSATLAAGKIKQSGPILVSFTGSEISNKINQSKQLYLEAGKPEKYGNINLEFEPAKQDFANTVIIGPITDKYGNAVNAFNYKLKLSSEDEEVKEFTNIDVQSGFIKMVLPSTFFAGEKLNLEFLDEADKKITDRTFEIDATKGKPTLSEIPKELKNNKNLQFEISGISLTNQSQCLVKFIKSSDEVLENKYAYDNTEDKCKIDWDVNLYRNAEKALVHVEIGDKAFNQVVSITSGEAVNLFTIAPQIRINKQNELELKLLTSPITDKYGKVVDKAPIKWQYNGKIVQSTVDSGISQLSLPASKLETRDIKVTDASKYLDLDLDVKAGITSISKTNNLQIYTGNYDISNKVSSFEVVRASSQISNQNNTIFAFKTDACSGELITTNSTQLLKTHLQGGICYVEATSASRDNKIVFKKDGFDLGEFNYSTITDPQNIIWCTLEKKNCMIQVFTPVNSIIDVRVFDEDKEYKFSSKDLENVVVINQNGLNPLKKYSVEIKYKDLNNQEVTHTREITGEKLISKE